MKKLLLALTIIILSFSMFANPGIRVLVFSKTHGYYHECTPNAIKALYEIGHEQKWKITFTEDSTLFTDETLKKFDVVVFLMTVGDDLLNDNQKRAFEKFIQHGGGFVGIHSATCTEYKWAWYGKLVGAYFTGHPPVQPGKIIIENRNHPSTRHFETDTLAWVDEWYSFDKNPRNQVQVLISVDEKSYNTNDNPWFKGVNLAMGDHPLVWCHKFDGGRSFQTALGHQPESFDSPILRKHLQGAIEWASGKG